MRKIFCLFLCLVVALSVFAISSCGNNEDPAGSGSTESSKAMGDEGLSSVTSEVPDEDSGSTAESDVTGSDEVSGTTSDSDRGEGADSSASADSTIDSDSDNSVGTDSTIDSDTDDSVNTDSTIDSDTDGSVGTDSTTDSDTDGSVSTDSTIDSDTDGSVSTDSTIDSDTDGSVSTDSTIDSDTDNSGSTDDSDNTTGGDDNKDEDNVNKITVSFVCFMYEPVSGETEVKIDKGSVILPEQMPVYKRDGYVMVWSYDMFGEDRWQASDVFDKDTDLFGSWVEVDYYEELKEKLLGLTNFQMDTVVSTEAAAGESGYSAVYRYDGDDTYMIITAGEMIEEAWYVDGIYYTVIGEELYTKEISKEEFDGLYGITVGINGAGLAIDKDLVRSVSKKDSVYTIDIDEVKYTEAVEGNGIVYSSIKYQMTFDENGAITHITVVNKYSQGEVPFTVTTRAVIVNVGTTVVEAPIAE